MRAARILESNGKFSEAEQAYIRLDRDFPDSGSVSEARFRLGLVALLQGGPAAAKAAWSRLGDVEGASQHLALGLLWRGKLAARTGDQSNARAFWQQAEDLQSNTYGTLRSADLMAGRFAPVTSGPQLEPARISLSESELADLSEWTAARGSSLGALVSDLAAEPGLARADELLALNLRNEAGWEFDELGLRRTDDPARLSALALALQQRGLNAQALRLAQLTLNAARIDSAHAPVALQKLLYPLPYVDILTTQSERQGTDPLLLAALVWQESKFNPTARSSANALGLTQIVPSTGQGIASALKRPSFEEADLYKPAISLEFGAYYLGERLRRFGGALLPALAAYNAGATAVDGWLSESGADDQDLFAERIPYSETAHYVKIVYETAGSYRRLYGSG